MATAGGARDRGRRGGEPSGPRQRRASGFGSHGVLTVTEAVYRRAASLLEAPFGEELVALDRASGRCLSFNPVAADVWKLLAEPRSVAQIVELLLPDYAVEPGKCEEDVVHLLTDLEKKGLVSR